MAKAGTTYKYVKPANVSKVAAGWTGAAAALFIFSYLVTAGAITVTGHTNDIACGGPIECDIRINFTSNVDNIYVQANSSWYLSSNGTITNLKLWVADRRFKAGWREINLSAPSDYCKINGCGYAVNFYKGKLWEVKYTFNKEKYSTLKWSFGYWVDPLLLSIKDMYVVEDLGNSKKITFPYLTEEHDLATIAILEGKNVKDMNYIKITDYAGKGQISLKIKANKTKEVTDTWPCDCVTDKKELPNGSVILTETCKFCEIKHNVTEEALETFDPLKHKIGPTTQLYETGYNCLKIADTGSGWGCRSWSDVSILGEMIEGATWWNVSCPNRWPIITTNITTPNMLFSVNESYLWYGNQIWTTNVTGGMWIYNCTTFYAIANETNVLNYENVSGATLTGNNPTLNYERLLNRTWHLENNGTVIPDSTANAISCVQNATTIPVIAGKFGKALNFSGLTVSKLNCTAAPIITDNISVEAWVYIISIPDYFTMVSKPQDIGPSQGWGAGWGLTGGTAVTGGGVIFWVNSWNTNYARNLSVVTLNTWHHFVGTYSKTNASTQVNLYMDGVVQTPDTFTSDITDQTGTPVSIGGGIFAVGGKCLNGYIDEVRIYTRVLTPTEIKEHYYNGINNATSVGAAENYTASAILTNVSLLFPPNNTINYTNAINFGFLPNVTSPANCTVWGNFSGTFAANQTNTSVITNGATNTIATTAPDGTYIWNMWCCNSTGTCNSSIANWTLIVNGVLPTITISSPVNGTVYTTTTQVLNVSAYPTPDTWIYQYNGNGTNKTFTPNTTFFLSGSDGLKNITVWANSSGGRWNSSVSYFYMCTAAPVLYLDGQNINRKYEYGTNATIFANCTCGFVQVCLNMTGYGQLNCSTQNVTYNFSADAKEYLFNDSLTSVNMSYGNGASNKSAYVFMHSRDEIGSFKLNLTGYYTNNSFPTNVKIWLNNTLLYSVSQLSTGTVTESTFNDSSSSKNFTQLDSGTKIEYIEIPYGSNVTSAYMNVTGYIGPWNEKMITVDSGEQFYYNMTNQSMPGAIQYHLKPSDWASVNITWCYYNATGQGWLFYIPAYPQYSSLSYIAEGWPCYLNGIGIDTPIYYGYQNMSGYGVSFNWTFGNSTMPLAVQNRIGNWSDVDFVNCTNSSGTFTYNTTTGGLKNLTNIARGDECKIYTIQHLCYQESMNVINQTGIDGDCGLIYTGSRSTTFYNVGDDRYFDMIYKVPANSINNVTWRIKYTNQSLANFTENISVKQCIYNGQIGLRFHWSGAINPGYAECYDGSSWETLVTFQYSNPSGSTGTGAANWFDGNWNTAAHKSGGDNNVYETVVGGTYIKIYEEAMIWNVSSYTLYNTSYPTDVYIDIENDGTVDWNYTGNYTINNRTGDFKDDFNHYLNSVCVPVDGVCKIPVKFGNARGGTLGIKNITINYTMSINPVSLNATAIQNYLQKLPIGYTNLSLKIESQSNGTAELYGLNVTYFGYQNYTVNATMGTLYNNKTLEVSYSNISAGFPPYINFYAFVPANRTQMNVTPFGQNYTQFAMNVTVKNYHDTVNISIFFNATPDSCKNITFNTIGNKTGGRIINATRWTPYTNLAYMNSTFYWFWEDVVNCSYAIGWFTDYLFIEPICYNCVRDW